MYISPLPIATDSDVDKLRDDIANKLLFTVGKDPAIATKREWLNATLYAVRDRMVERWHRSNRAQFSQDARHVYYLSMEFLIGRTLSNALLSLGIYDEVRSALEAMGLELEELIDEENDPDLVMAVLVVWRPVSLILWQRLACRDVDTAFAITTVCLNKISSTAYKKSRWTIG